MFSSRCELGTRPRCVPGHSLACGCRLCKDRRWEQLLWEDANAENRERAMAPKRKQADGKGTGKGTSKKTAKTADEPAEFSADELNKMSKEDMKKHLLALPKPSGNDFYKFHKAIPSAPKHIVEEYEAIKNMKMEKGRATGKHDRLRVLVQAYKLSLKGNSEGNVDPWSFAFFNESVEIAEEDSVGSGHKAVPWGIMVGLHGGNESVAIAALQRGEIKEVTNDDFEKNGGPRTLFQTMELSGSSITKREHKRNISGQMKVDPKQARVVANAFLKGADDDDDDWGMLDLGSSIGSGSSSSAGSGAKMLTDAMQDIPGTDTQAIVEAHDTQATTEPVIVQKPPNTQAIVEAHEPASGEISELGVPIKLEPEDMEIARNRIEKVIMDMTTAKAKISRTLFNKDKLDANSKAFVDQMLGGSVETVQGLIARYEGYLVGSLDKGTVDSIKKEARADMIVVNKFMSACKAVS